MSDSHGVFLAVAFVTAAALAAASGAAGADTIRPGYWESTSRVTSPIHTTKTERRCITATDVGKFMACRINHIYQCSCPGQVTSGGVIRFQGRCVDKHGQSALIEGHGDYTETTLSLAAHVTAKWHGLPISIDAATEARRIGDDCPAQATPGSGR